MPILRCTVRGCEGALAVTDSSLRCPHGHAFDRAREGYWNLLQPQDRRSPRAGDRDKAVLARRRWLARGFADGLVQTLGATIDGLGLPSRATVLDVPLRLAETRRLRCRPLDDGNPPCGQDRAGADFRRRQRRSRSSVRRWIDRARAFDFRPPARGRVSPCAASDGHAARRRSRRGRSDRAPRSVARGGDPARAGGGRARGAQRQVRAGLAHGIGELQCHVGLSLARS